MATAGVARKVVRWHSHSWLCPDAPAARAQCKPDRQPMLHLSILRPRPDSIAGPRSRAILAAAPRRREATRHAAQTSTPLRRHLRYLLLLLFLLTPLPNRAHSGTLRIPFRTVRSMILIEAEVNGEPVTLLMDTGATSTVINAQSYRATYFPL